ncbi:conserved uncharacterized protein [Candidatus Moduliflexus flocculans]|uniref:Conserved uncharacterized protein n=1 Tax=Candidatus Moduliflexus flocculans TaxID=1499966 RepID=A0A0S6VSP5_9BACT|nr:conserved uncharacterized protein [Candidatus Moduliflexus flocculans]
MLCAQPIAAQEINEDDLFSTDPVQEESTPKAESSKTAPQSPDLNSSEEDIFSSDNSVSTVEESKDDSLATIMDQESISFSGELAAKFGASLMKDYLDGDADFEDNPYWTSVEGDFLLDLRWKKGIKAFGDLWLSYSPLLNGTNANENAPPGETAEEPEEFDTILKELFVDVNIAKKVYFRFGKQALRWGRCYFWNPTDLLSEDRKSFTDMNARLEGEYGLKMHVPFGTAVNVYGFSKFSNADNLSEIAAAGKVEWLLPGDIEIGLSAWDKKDYHPMFGFDFATYKLRISWRGEMSLIKGDNRVYLEQNDAGEWMETKNDKDEWVARFALGATKTFDYGNYNDRISVTVEAYHDPNGYDTDMFEDATVRQAFLAGDYYLPNYYGQWYMAVFSSVAKFLVSDLTLNLDLISNLTDSSWLLSPGVSYEMTSNAILQFDVTGHFGEENREYTFGGQAIDFEARLNLTF